MLTPVVVLLLDAATVLGKLVAQLATYRPIKTPATATAVAIPKTLLANRFTFDPPLTPRSISQPVASLYTRPVRAHADLTNPHENPLRERGPRISARRRAPAWAALGQLSRNIARSNGIALVVRKERHELPDRCENDDRMSPHWGRSHTGGLT